MLMKLEKDEAWRKLVGNRLRVTREALGRKQAPVARALKVTPQRLNNYETGRRPVDITFAIEFCNEFGATLDWLYRGIIASLPTELHDRVRFHYRDPDIPRH